MCRLAKVVLCAAMASCSGTPPAMDGSNPAPITSTSTSTPCPDALSVEVHEAAPEVMLTLEVVVQLEAPAGLSVAVGDGAPEQRPVAQQHRFPLMGLQPDADLQLQLMVTCESAAPRPLPAVDLPAVQGPELWPIVTVHADDPDRREPGVTLIDLASGDRFYVAVLRPDGSALWVYEASERVVDSRLEPDGTLWLIEGYDVVHLDLLGRVLGRWGPPTSKTARTEVDVVDFHHEVYPLPDGFLSMESVQQRVPAYPRNPNEPDGPFVSTNIVDTRVVDVALDGTVRQRYSMAEVLDTRRIGWLSMRGLASGWDWSHANAMLLDPRDGHLVVSVRHQSAVVKVDRQTGELLWILGTSAGWREPWSKLLLEPVGEVSWPSNQHAPMLTDDGRIVMFDNGNFHRTTPYTPAAPAPDEPLYSRVLILQVDDAAGTVQPVAIHEQTSTGRQFAGAFGDADFLPQTGNVLGNWGFLLSEDGVTNEEAGRGVKSVRLVEFSPAGEVVWELGLHSERKTRFAGWQTHRAQRLVLPAL
ncbi:MAG: aryl-sulfate sulfotransferase [Myxococcales bacterium]|nr:aryl-sulfate sulfotransferase [Myxococcales bacterium]